MLTTSAVVLAKLQTGAGAQAACSATADALLVDSPDYSVDPTILERKFALPDLSPLPHLIGRKLASVTFTIELRGNNKQQSGLLSDAPRILRLFQACGYAASSMSGTAALNTSPVFPDSNNPSDTPAVTWAKTGTITALTKPVLYTLTVTGASNAYSLASNDGNAPVTGTATSGTAIPLGTSGASIAPTFTGSLPVGATFRILTLPIGLKLSPITDNAQYLTLEVYFDGLKHVLFDAMGTFRMTATAGDYSTLEFTFTGRYVPTVDAPIPANAIYEDTLPSQVELANLTWGSKRDLVVNSFTFDQANSVVSRPDVNAADGFRGVRISGRAPSGGFDPETELEASAPFWADFMGSVRKHWVANVGTQQGNTVVMHGPQVQTSGQRYNDRDNLRTYDITTLFKRTSGNDENFFYFI